MFVFYICLITLSLPFNVNYYICRRRDNEWMRKFTFLQYHCITLSRTTTHLNLTWFFLHTVTHWIFFWIIFWDGCTAYRHACTACSCEFKLKFDAIQKSNPNYAVTCIYQNFTFHGVNDTSPSTTYTNRKLLTCLPITLTRIGEEAVINQSCIGHRSELNSNAKLLFDSFSLVKE